MVTRGIADFDPDGVSILLNYKYGSISLSHERTIAITPQLKWLGCLSDHISGRLNALQNHGLRHLSHRDRKRAIDMLQWPYMAESWGEASWRRELQVMLTLGYKFEIEMLEQIQDHLSVCLDYRLAERAGSEPRVSV